jgi:hypothetical protein
MPWRWPRRPSDCTKEPHSNALPPSRQGARSQWERRWHHWRRWRSDFGTFDLEKVRARPRTVERGVVAAPVADRGPGSCAVRGQAWARGAGAGDQPAFAAAYRNRDNGLIYETNKREAPGAHVSSKMERQSSQESGQRHPLLRLALWEKCRPSTSLSKNTLRRVCEAVVFLSLVPNCLNRIIKGRPSWSKL